MTDGVAPQLNLRNRSTPVSNSAASHFSAQGTPAAESDVGLDFVAGLLQGITRISDAETIPM